MARSMSRMGFVGTARNFNKAEVGRRITSLNKDDRRGTISDIRVVNGRNVIIFCIDGRHDIYSLEEKEFYKEFTLLSKNEEAGMNYFFNNLPDQLVIYPSEVSGDLPVSDDDIPINEMTWSPFDDFNFS